FFYQSRYNRFSKRLHLPPFGLPPTVLTLGSTMTLEPSNVTKLGEDAASPSPAQRTEPKAERKGESIALIRTKLSDLSGEEKNTEPPSTSIGRIYYSWPSRLDMQSVRTTSTTTVAIRVRSSRIASGPASASLSRRPKEGSSRSSLFNI